MDGDSLSGERPEGDGWFARRYPDGEEEPPVRSSSSSVRMDEKKVLAVLPSRGRLDETLILNSLPMDSYAASTTVRSGDSGVGGRRR